MLPPFERRVRSPGGRGIRDPRRRGAAGARVRREPPHAPCRCDSRDRRARARRRAGPHRLRRPGACHAQASDRPRGPTTHPTRRYAGGSVLGADCKPIRRTLLDFWQADGDGNYDTEGYRLRGHQFTDARGRFRLVTETRAVHGPHTAHPRRGAAAARRGAHYAALLPRRPGNEQDGIFDPALLTDVRGSRAAFDFVLA